MRYLLAIVSFVIAAPLLAWAAFVVYQLVQYFQESGMDFSEPEVQFACGMVAVSGFVGLAFLAAGTAVLAKKSRREK